MIFIYFLYKGDQFNSMILRARLLLLYLVFHCKRIKKSLQLLCVNLLFHRTIVYEYLL